MKKKWMGGLLALGVLLLRDGPLCIHKPGSWHITKACLQNLWKEAYARRRGVHPLDGRESP